MKSFKVGAIVLATDQGLGYLAKDFFDHGLIDKVLIHEHSTRTNHREWYPRSAVVSSTEELIETCDIIFGIETFFDWKVIPKARQAGKKTVLMPMYECTPNPLPYIPDLVLSPSDLDSRYYPGATRINVPVVANPRLRQRACVFVHNAGNGGLGGRNGTKELIAALPLVKSQIKLILRSQGQIGPINDPRVDLRVGTFDNIWEEGDVFIFPEKFNGLSLPIQEAYANGMLVMATNRFPFNSWLPTEPLIPVKEYSKQRIAVEFDMAELSPVDIANTIDTWYNQDISNYSQFGIEWGKENNWETLGPIYIDIFEKLWKKNESSVGQM